MIKLHGKVINFERKSNGGWKRARADLRVQAAGFVRDSDCNFPGGIGRTERKRAKSLNAVYRAWDPPTWAKYKKKEAGANCNVGLIFKSIVID